MRTLRITALLALALAFTASAALACPACCTSKQVKATSASNTDLSTVFAGAGSSCSVSKAKLAEYVEIEATKLPSGTLVVQYRGKNADAVAYLQTAAEGSIENFCCPLARKVAATDAAHIEMTKTNEGALVVVTSEKPEVVEEYAHAVMTLASTSR